MRTIKRYSNRKLYDTEKKRYITLDGIAGLIREGTDIEVVDNDTGENLTAVTLSQIIFEQQKRGSRAPLGFLTSLIRTENGSPLEMLRRSLSLSSNVFSAVEKEIERRLQELVEQGEMTADQMRRLQSDLLLRFQESERRPRESEPERDEASLDHPMHRLGIPTYDDLQALGQQIEQLNARLDQLISLSRRPRSRANSEVDLPAPDQRTRK